MNRTTSKSFRKRLPLTTYRLMAARVLYRLVRLVFRDKTRRICRGGISYEVDLSEGIDLSLFLFGGFQNHIFDNTHIQLPPDGVALDVGANIGAMTLPLAKRMPQGSIYAFEPTDYAYAKLLHNISLNPAINKNITVTQTFLGEKSSQEHDMKAYSSWKVDKKRSDTHPLHGGAVRQADKIGVLAIDDFCRDLGVERLDLIKIDTDGFEYGILKGATGSIAKFRPTIIFETGGYLMEESNVAFSDYAEFFGSKGYRMIDSKNGKSITMENYLDMIPANTSLDIIALPGES
ncbi:MAG: FkbM family methyltransferase [bacterium]|nr:FkbM family methyltransferase [bacterium]